MSELLQYTMFQRVLFPDQQVDSQADVAALVLNRVIRFQPLATTILADAPLVIFDFETTGLDAREDRIIEIGAQKIQDGKVVGEFSTLVKPDIPLPVASTQITGITEEMLRDQPSIDKVLLEFLDFIQGSFLAAHNAEFDMSFLVIACQRLGYQLNWPCFCTLKLARALLPELESKSLDALAGHFGLSFEARHRSIGDVKVTTAVLDRMLAREGERLSQWQHFDPYKVA